MTVRQAAGRLKHAALVLAGYRPAEVRFDQSDRAIASLAAARWTRMSFGSLPREQREDIEMTIYAAIDEYATWDKEAWLRELERDEAEEVEQMVVPFRKTYEQTGPERPSA